MSIPTISAWSVKYSMLGNIRLEFDCPSCGSNLTANLSESGKADNCPDCNSWYILPPDAAESAKAEIEQAKKDQKHKEAVLARRKRAQELARKKSQARKRDGGWGEVATRGRS